MTFDDFAPVRDDDAGSMDRLGREATMAAAMWIRFKWAADEGTGNEDKDTKVVPIVQCNQ